ncbi:sugar-transfer associated ATP-grasp domain-containing protein [Dongia sp.]|uniref:sugar-transfer associated ATP-grasp domain-containing protein n=1 Tax=Dongia sp. TaxID=1977262 RepID=UPI0035AECE96
MGAGSLKGIKVTVQKLPPPLPLAWAFASGGTDRVKRLHRTHYRAVWRSRGMIGRLELFGLLLCWPLIVLARICYTTRRNGAMVRARTGKSLWRQAWEQLLLAARFGIVPDYYYKLDFYLPEHFGQAAHYVQRGATKDSLYRLLKPDDTAWSPLTDKVVFAQYCLARDIPVAPIVASLREGRIDGTFDALPAADLFVKRTRGRGGSRAELWRHAAGIYRNDGGLELDAAAFMARLVARSTREPYLVQRRLVNHPALRDLAQGALATLRVVSAIDEGGRPEAIRAVFRMPARADSIVDNFHAGGIAAAVDLATGRLGPATDMGLAPSTGWINRHPLSGAQINGRILPQCTEMVATVLAAHKAFADRAIVGWDVALTDQGIVIVEGNAATDTDIIQRCHRAPLSQSRYPDLMLWHLDRLGRL